MKKRTNEAPGAPAAGAFESKLSRLLRMMTAEDWEGALRMAAKFPDLGAHKAAITRAWDAHQSPSLYRQMGKDPAALWAAGIEALKERYLK
jgi:hypothetical protein